MITTPWDSTGQARRALQGIVRDQHYGAAALSQPAVMSNLLKDLLPDEPREAGLLVAAAQADLAGALRGYVAQGLDPGTAVNLTTNTFVTSTSHTPEACSWVVTELALALGLNPQVQQATAQQATLPPPGQPTVIGAPNAAFQQATPPYSPVGPAGGPWQQPSWAATPVAASPGNPLRIVAGIAGLFGALFILLGCILPYIKYPSERAIGIFSGFPGSPGSSTFWFASEPVVVLVAAIVVAIVMMARRPGGIFGPGMLTAFGIQTIFLFAGYVFTVYTPEKRYPGAILGLLGGIALLAAGLMSLAAARQQRSLPQQVTGPPQAAGTVPGQVPPGVIGGS